MTQEVTDQAIISYWNLNGDNVMRCTSSFNVQDPVKRPVLNLNGTVLNQVIFEGNGELFFFVKRKPSELSDAT